LIEGAGSIDRVIPPWLQSVVLGNGDPAIANYKSETMKAYAVNTVGVNKPTDYLDFGDTFLDETHLRDSFNVKVIVEDRDSSEDKSKEDDARCNFKIQFTEEKKDDGTTESAVDAVSLSFPSGVAGNPVRFTPVQVEAIRSGLSPGLTMVVGPPGTGMYSLLRHIVY
jgi:intron-binding protein aquarius